mgnify:CR=1 FL=1
MKKFLSIIVLGLLWSSNGVTDILLDNCKIVQPVGSLKLETIDGENKFVPRTKEKVNELKEDERQEFYVSVEDGAVYKTRVASRQWVKVGEILGYDWERVDNIKYTITFADEKLIIAKGKHILTKDAPDDSYYTLAELEINLENGEIRITQRAETAPGQEFISIMKKVNGNTFILFRCEFESFQESKEGSSGTAFFINKKGYLLTNNHVVEGCTLSKISYKNKDYDTKLIATDKTLDLALLKAELKPKTFINFSNDEAKKLNKVYVAGYPLGKGLSDDLKISSGIVSSIKGFEDNSNEIQIDAPINPGNSGGPIINENGDLIAIAVAGITEAQNINFGIKSSAAERFLKSNNINVDKSSYSRSKNNEQLRNILEEGTVYTYCD